jgi:thiol-disulfide isomerase/thioredoxin
MTKSRIFIASLSAVVLIALAAFKPSAELKVTPTKVFADTLDLSKFKGKIVVLNFWASWSKISRAENKNVVRVYQKYRQNSKLAFASVSLDVDEKSWKTAIDEDEMVWADHVCDFKKYASPIAIQYGVTTLPKLILIDKTGKVHVTATKMSDIEATLDSLMKQ